MDAPRASSMLTDDGGINVVKLFKKLRGIQDDSDDVGKTSEELIAELSYLQQHENMLLMLMADGKTKPEKVDGYVRSISAITAEMTHIRLRLAELMGSSEESRESLRAAAALFGKFRVSKEDEIDGKNNSPGPLSGPSLPHKFDPLNAQFSPEIVKLGRRLQTSCMYGKLWTAEVGHSLVDVVIVDDPALLARGVEGLQLWSRIPTLSGIIACHGFATLDDDAVAVVLDRSAGHTQLDAAIEQNELPVTMCVELLEQLANTVCSLNQFGLFVRDLSPSTITLDEEANRLNVALWEVGRKGESFLGVPLMAAPELFAGESNSLATEVFAWGTVAWCLLSRTTSEEHKSLVLERLGSSLEDHDDMLEAYAGLLKSGFRPTVSMELPQTLRALLKRCWSADPSDRPNWEDILSSLHGSRHTLSGRGRRAALSISTSTLTQSRGAASRK